MILNGPGAEHALRTECLVQTLQIRCHTHGDSLSVIWGTWLHEQHSLGPNSLYCPVTLYFSAVIKKLNWWLLVQSQYPWNNNFYLCNAIFWLLNKYYNISLQGCTFNYHLFLSTLHYTWKKGKLKRKFFFGVSSSSDLPPLFLLP